MDSEPKLFLYSFRDFDEKQYYVDLAAKGGFTYATSPDYADLENAELARGFDGISTTVKEVNAQLLERFHDLGVKYILCRSIGVDHVDLEAAKRLGMRVSHLAYEPETVADYTIMMIMMGLRKMRHIMERSIVQDYTLKGKIGKDICECTIGVIGTGHIGATVIKHLQSFGCKILAYDVFKNPSLEGMCEYTDLNTLYANADVITLHIPETPEMHHFINKASFDAMKPGCLLVNTARGALVDADAMIEALESGKLSGASLDVIEEESDLYYLNRVGDCIPNRVMAQLRSFPNVILTPHTAFYTDRVVRTMAEQTIQCLFDMAAGRDNPLILF